jgi:hypothetical protein
MPHSTKEAQREYFLNNKDKFRAYGVKYYDENKYEINRRRLLRRIEKGGSVRMSSLDEYDIETKECEGKCKILT